MFQLSFCTKEILQPRRGAFGKLDQKSHIAGGRVEIVGSCCRAKHIQAAGAEALENGGDAGKVLRDGEILGGCMQNVACTRARALGNADEYRRVAMLTLSDTGRAETA